MLKLAFINLSKPDSLIPNSFLNSFASSSFNSLICLSMSADIVITLVFLYLFFTFSTWLLPFKISSSFTLQTIIFGFNDSIEDNFVCFLSDDFILFVRSKPSDRFL